MANIKQNLANVYTPTSKLDIFEDYRHNIINKLQGGFGLQVACSAKQLILGSMLIACLSCVENDYLFHKDIPAPSTSALVYPINTLKLETKIDILMVMDNSASMSSIQDKIIQNAQIFFKKFVDRPNINWKLGIVSTDKGDQPYLGFEQSFDYSNLNGLNAIGLRRGLAKFNKTVERIGTNGDTQELVFFNIKKALDWQNTDFNHFHRLDAHLAIIMITDEYEQSEEVFGEHYQPHKFLKLIQSNYMASNKIVRFYGALSFHDLENCSWGTMGRGGYNNYKGGKLHKIIELTDGFVISACINNFGAKLAELGEDIISLVGMPSLLLEQRPIVESLEIYYKNQLLPPGEAINDGMWFYEEQTNTINFYNIDFIEDVEKDSLQIDFEINDGLDRS